MDGFNGKAKDVSAEIETELKKLALPEKVKMVAIYKLYKEIKKIDAEKEKEIKIADKKNLKQQGPIITNQNEIINGQRDIKIEEVKNAEKFLTPEQIAKIPENLGAHRIPEYWLKAFKNTDILKDEIKEYDEQILKSLRTIKVVDEEEQNDNFQVVFTFDENAYFTNTQLKKKFFMKDDYPYKTTGTQISWIEGKDITKKQVKKKQKNKKSGQSRVVSKVVDADSFFNFFKSSDLPEGKDPMTYDENEQQLAQKIDIDFELAGAIVDECVSYSLEYYLGVKAQDDEDDEDFDDEDEDDDDQSKKSSKSKEKKTKKGVKAALSGDSNVEKPECKQQ